MIDRYHPWGPVQWLLPRLGSEPWSLLGGVGTEERSTALVSVVPVATRHSSLFVEIQDPDPPRPSALALQMAIIRGLMASHGVDNVHIRTAGLLQDIDTIREYYDEFVESSYSRVILDISVLPKRWFFPFIRFLQDDGRISDVVVTYASAETYGRQLSSDPAQIAPLPTFDGDPDQSAYEELIVAIGFAPLGLRDLYTSEIDKIRYLFPFPPGPPNFNRNWRFLRELETEIENRNSQADDHWHVHMYDCPSTFSALCKFTENGRRVTALAPFGPKTLSLAMCLFALALEEKGRSPAHVLYTQPRRYALDYSTGIKNSDGAPDIKGYLIKSNGKSLYTLDF